MGQYFTWVNLDKKEYIGDNPWAVGLKLIENCYEGNEKTDAALTMLDSRWKGDRVVFLGDYASFENETDPFRRRVEEELKGQCVDDFMDHTFHDIAGIFTYVKTSPWCDYYDEETETTKPYEGPFDTEIVHHRYVVNETLKEYVDRSICPVRYIREDGKVVRYDPIPELLSSNKAVSPESGEVDGLWFGHEIRPSHTPPGKGYKLVAENRTYWDFQTVLTVDNATIERIIHEHDIDLKNRDTGDLFMEIESHLDER